MSAEGVSELSNHAPLSLELMQKKGALIFYDLTVITDFLSARVTPDQAV